MQLESYFLDKSAFQRLQIFKYMSAALPKRVSINEVSQETGLSYQQAYRSFHDLLLDLKRCQPNLADSDEFTVLAANVSSDNYRLDLLQHSAAYAFFNTAFQDGKVDVEAFCNQYAISQSTLRRRIKPFGDYLAAHHLKISLAKPELQGDESLIRLMIVIFYLLVYHGNGWALDHISEARGEELYQHSLGNPFDKDPHNLAKHREDVSLIAVQAQRIKQGHLITDDSRLKLIAPNHYPHDTFFKAAFPTLTPEDWRREFEYYCFAQFFFISLHPGNTDGEQKMIDRLNETPNPVRVFCTDMMAYFWAAVPASAALREQSSLMRNLYQTVYAHYALHGDMVRRLDFLEDQRAEDRIVAEVDQFIDHLEPDSPASVFKHYPTLPSSIAYIVWPYLSRLDPSDHLTVRVIMESESLPYRDLLIFLRDVSFIDIVPTNDLKTHAEVVISSFSRLDAKLLLSEDAKQNFADLGHFLYWPLEATDTEFLSLYMQLRHIYDDKQIQQLTKKD
ncbi:hypothetical protein IV38_GL001399 [Lactobacillus selangorensis]|uniref:Mga helix-turn-helix domain-containing protein n=1 Tax=Lactobacillus selangorensis TaxID=81857 RepID=A0A0R2G3I5_9LACO|nr:helix-turn-helix domain-containing protein [Lactobacillus selangorensis]KRN28399.1 hypothetical protein IV38_GL001399 [Lactobacillus selangorensis]KRN31900.1 hypothetical protein IV40_GL001186 [Lactobacillus selangorensis]